MKFATSKLVNKTIAITTLFCMTTQGVFANYLQLADAPLFIGANVPPQVMLTISKEQQLYKKAYNDYSDLDDDGVLETTYKHAVDYYGYFDSYKCYVYNTGIRIFEPVFPAKDRDNTTDDKGKPTAAAIEKNKEAKYCTEGSGQWSGNFLNWISMSRMDTVRKLLYGGMRSTDTASATILERAAFPTDAHAWAKYYPGNEIRDPATGRVIGIDNDIPRLTPFKPAMDVTSFSAATGKLTFRACPSGAPETDPKPFQFPLHVAKKPIAISPIFSGPDETCPGVMPEDEVTREIDVPLDTATGISVGDQIMIESASYKSRPGADCSLDTTTPCVIGTVASFPGAPSATTVRLRVNRGLGRGIQNGGATAISPYFAPGDKWRVTNFSHTGISFCNVTYPTSGLKSLSHTNQDPPLIRVAQGNFQLWSASARFQCEWQSEYFLPSPAKFDGPGANGNLTALSGIKASAENPSRREHALGGPPGAPGDFVARVAACVPGLFGTERCKQYPRGNYKPIGLLQEYGDVDLIQFGLMTGSFAKNISGGVLRKNISSFAAGAGKEVNVDTDGTFTSSAASGRASAPPGSPRDVHSATTPPGIVSTLNYLRIWGYNYEDGLYSTIDKCDFQRTNIVEGSCTSWGNPMSEIYFESLRYFAGNSPTDEFTYKDDGSKDNQLGLPSPKWKDPLSQDNYCAPINVLVFNASVSTNDDDLRDKSAASIKSSQTAAQLTNTVGDKEGITFDPTGNKVGFFVGKILGSSATPSSDPNFELCTPKNIPGLGDVSGICPEGPTVAGSYLMAGLAHHARTNRIRTDIDVPSTDTRSLKVTTYGIQLATNVPTLTIPVPGSTTGQKVIIQPIYRLRDPSGGLGGGALVDLKFIEQKTVGNVSTGRIYLNWDDSEQGGDYDQDMWGTLEWVLDASANTIRVTTTAIAQSTNQPQGFGYVISGTTQDGPHFHSGIFGFNYPDATGKEASGVPGCANCQVLGAGGQSGPQPQNPAPEPPGYTYKLGTSTGKTLQDPMWYAAKYGAFIDSNDNGIPDLQSEWDSKLTNGQQAPNGIGDGIPDTYFLVTNPLGLVAALERAFIAILSNASASSVATNSTSLQTGTTIYQARFNANDWSGQVLAFAVDGQGQIARDPTWDAGQIVNAQDPLDTASPPAKAAVSTDADAIKGSGRTIITFNNTPGVKAGVPFRWPVNPASPTSLEIGTDLVAALNLGTSGSPPIPDGRGQQRLDYLRGSQANEGAAVTGFRVRAISRLGDIVNSNPNFIGAPNSGFGDDLYTKFRQDNMNRQSMIYVGGNDGMLHGFRAQDGREVLAYVPSMVHNKLNRLTDKTYVGSAHRYYVDGSPEIGDAFINVKGVNAWHTVLVGSLGGGGQGLFALDVTKPEDFSEANAGKIALWEFSDKDDPDLGFIYAQPTIRRMANGKFAAIVPGGYNNSKPETGELQCTNSASRVPAGCTTSSTGSAYLFIIFLDGPGTDGVWNEGTDYIKIRAAVRSDTPNTPDGLTQPLAADVDADGFVDFIYAGDLRGDLWKFDVRLPAAASPLPPVPNTSAPITTWTSGNNRVILFVARDPDTGRRQPITGKPEATLHPTSGFIIAFGTGKYLERNDPYPPSGPPPNIAVPYQAQSFYGIWDKNDAKPIARASADPSLAPAPSQTVVTSRDQLLPHEIQSTPGNAAIRVVVPVDGKPEVPDWSATNDPAIRPPDATDSPPKHMGWILDFPKSTDTGERSVFRPILTAGRLIFTTLLPLTQACQFGGTSFTMVVDPTTGGRIDGPVLDTDANSLLNSKDVVSYGGKEIYASGVQSTIGITPTPTIIRATSQPPDTTSRSSQILGTSGPLVAASGVLLAYALSAGSSGGNASTMIGLSAAGGRVSWRELTAD